MHRLSVIINEIYNKYLPLAEKYQVQLNLDFLDTTQEISDPKQFKSDLETQLQTAINRTNHGKIDIIVQKGQIIIKDSGTILSKPLCRLMSKGRMNVKSRVGFGTTITINLNQAETTTSVSAK